MWSHYSKAFKGLIVSALILTGIQTSIHAQDVKFTDPAWWFGVAGGGNLNFYRGSTQELNSDLIAPTVFHNGTGLGLYLAPLLEYHRPDSRLGVMLQIGYDNRKGKFKEVISPCNCPEDLRTNLSYITIEPSLRLAPFKSNFYIYGGPRLAFNLGKSFTYKKGFDPNSPADPTDPAYLPIPGDFSKMKTTIFSLQLGAGYDIHLSADNKQTKIVLSPFVALHPYFGQNPRSIETWNLTTLRFGLALKFGRGKKVEGPAPLVPVKVVLDPEVEFTVISPPNLPVERRMRETFPVRNYVFFDLGSTEIPDRYVLLNKDQVKEFTEDRMEVFTPKRLAGRSARQMSVYYNILNILGVRMVKNPEAVVRLSGASMEGREDGLAMAESIKRYLVSVFGIDPVRLNTEGRIKPRIPSEQPGGTKELVLLREGDHRVSIWSESPAILMQYQTGNDVPMQPIEVTAPLEAPVDSYVTFNVDGAKEAFSSWSLEIMDDKGVVKKFGPYKEEKIGIPGKAILGDLPKGDYKATMVGQTKSGKTVKKEASIHVVLWMPSEKEMGMRYSVIYEFNDSKSIAIYDKYLSETVMPKIPKDGTVLIHGYTDIIGDAAHNRELSLDRANDVKGILEKALAKANRTDVKFEVYGFGEDENLSPFENKYPEERFYNRSVIIDIIPAK
jgi:outer membrane protein OmpA-like peptidoglycan-associated protein